SGGGERKRDPGRCPGGGAVRLRCQPGDGPGRGAQRADPRAVRPPFYDPLATLAYLAAVTSRVRLGATVVLLPFRHPVLMARARAGRHPPRGALRRWLGTGRQGRDPATIALSTRAGRWRSAPPVTRGQRTIMSRWARRTR